MTLSTSLVGNRGTKVHIRVNMGNFQNSFWSLVRS